MLPPVMRRSGIVVMAIFLTSTVAFSHIRNEYYDYQDSEDDEDNEPFLVGHSIVNEGGFSLRDQESLNIWAPSGDSEINPNFKPSMMDTYEKFKRQAVKSVVPGDETIDLTEGRSPFSRLGSMVSWKTATLISVLCVGAAIVGVVLGVVYWPKTSFGERGEFSAVESKKGSAIESAGDRSLAHSAQMYHYQQQKQQMLAMDQAAGRVRSLSSNSDSEGECEEPVVNVYECPGLATVSEKEVKNPLYNDGQGESSGISSTKESK
nr:neural proliferation differentiation [Hymenolepis microstoma]